MADQSNAARQAFISKGFGTHVFVLKKTAKGASLLPRFEKYNIVCISNILFCLIMYKMQ